MSKKTDIGQAGLVSIIVTMIMMIVITLIVIGFSQVARRNQREALDRQLSSQAFYAAETGVNDTLSTIKAGTYNPSTDSTNYNDCGSNPSTSFIAAKLTGKTILNAAANVGYTCVLVNPKVQKIVETVDPGDSIVVPIRPSVTTPLTFTWQSTASATATSSGCTTAAGTHDIFTPVGTGGGNDWAANCKFGILRLDLFDATANSGSTLPDTMAAHTAAIYFVPAASGAAVSTLHYGAAAGANVIPANCTAGVCTAVINSSAFTLPMNLYARISAVYEGLGSVGINGSPSATFSDAQLLVDSTGKAQDELKRIQVRVPLSGGQGQSSPSAALQSTDSICKRFITLGAGHSAVPDYNSGTPLCADN